MIFAEKATNGEASFDLDASNPTVFKWSFRSCCLETEEAKIDRVIHNASKQKSTLRIKEIEKGLKALKIKLPVFIGEIIELLRIKEKDRSTQEAVLQYGAWAFDYFKLPAN